MLKLPNVLIEETIAGGIVKLSVAVESHPAAFVVAKV
jgi:hypothetical protein